MPSSNGITHIIGAGMAGLAAGVRLTEAGKTVAIHEASLHAGGRCRSYYDQATDTLIDNGMHILLSGNHAALSFATTIGSAASLQGPNDAEFPFVELPTMARWTLRLNAGRFPWWVFDPMRRVPDSHARDYLPLLRLGMPIADIPIGSIVPCEGSLYRRLLAPMLLAVLNIEPNEGSATLAAAVIRETLGRGGNACRPLIARNGIGNVFVEPAISYLHNHSVFLELHDELIALRFSGERVTALEFADRTVSLYPNDAVILAVPPQAAAKLVPGLAVPTLFRGIVNAHFRIKPSNDLPPMLGVVGGTCQWIFSLPTRISVTISDADKLFEIPRQELARNIWLELSAIMRREEALPPWQIVRERRATFAATPQQNALRPKAETAWRNLYLAGDWTATGLPATLEGAIRSGNLAADLRQQVAA